VPCHSLAPNRSLVFFGVLARQARSVSISSSSSPLYRPLLAHNSKIYMTSHTCHPAYLPRNGISGALSPIKQPWRTESLDQLRWNRSTKYVLLAICIFLYSLTCPSWEIQWLLVCWFPHSPPGRLRARQQQWCFYQAAGLAFTAQRLRPDHRRRFGGCAFAGQRSRGPPPATRCPGSPAAPRPRWLSVRPAWSGSPHSHTQENTR
jgi:hypothetical protein